MLTSLCPVRVDMDMALDKVRSYGLDTERGSGTLANGLVLAQIVPETLPWCVALLGLFGRTG